MTIDTARWIESLIPQKLGYYETMVATYNLARDVIERGVPGDFVECGVFAGAECAVMARAALDGGDEWNGSNGRRVHLFDSFQGIPAPGPEDSEFLQSGNQPGSAACSLPAVVANMERWRIPADLLVYHAGWFADTTPSPDPAQIALLRLDGDLYESTKTCLLNLWPRLSRTGWLIVDDYPLSGCRKALHEIVGYPQPGYFPKL